MDIPTLRLAFLVEPCTTQQEDGIVQLSVIFIK